MKTTKQTCFRVLPIEKSGNELVGRIWLWYYTRILTIHAGLRCQQY